MARLTQGCICEAFNLERDASGLVASGRHVGQVIGNGFQMSRSRWLPRETRTVLYSFLPL